MVRSYGNENEAPEQYRGSMLRCLLFGAFWGFVLYLLYYFLALVLPLEIIYVLALEICEWFPFIPMSPWSGIVFCMAICTGIGFFIRGSVKIYDDEIHVYGCGKTTRIPLNAFDHIEAKKMQIIIRLMPVILWRCFLYYRDGTGLRRCRLYGFDGGTADVLNNRIRIRSTEQMTGREKTEITDSVNSGPSEEQAPSGTEFTLEHDRLFAREALSLRRVLLLYIFFATACLILILLDHELSPVTAFELGGLAAVLIIGIPVRIVIFQKRKAMCPSYINVRSTGLRIDEKYFPYSEIDKIQLCRTKGTPAVPAQYFMVISASGREKCWLGSDASNPGYRSFCNTLQKAMAFFPDKLEYKDRGL